MAEATQVPTNGFQVPPGPAGAAPSVPALPSSADQQPGFVAPAQPNDKQFTAADVDRLVAERLAAQAGTAAPAAPAAPATPAAPVQITSTANDALLNSYTEAFGAIGEGIDLERALGHALQFGKPELIDTAYINEKGGAHAARLNVLAKAIVDHVQAQSTAGVQASYSIAGGEAQWNAAAAAFNTNAPEHLKQVVGEMLNSGNIEKIKSGAKMVTEYAGGNGYVAKPAGMVAAGVAGGNPSSALSKQEFQSGLQSLNKQAPDFIQKREALFAARALGKQLGR